MNFAPVLQNRKGLREWKHAILSAMVRTVILLIDVKYYRIENLKSLYNPVVSGRMSVFIILWMW